MLLGDPAHSRLTIHFLNAVLRPDSPIVSVEHLNPIVPQEFDLDKLSILDILAQDALGRRFNIEVQRTKPGWLPERLTYYAATQLVEQIGEGDSYNRLRPSIGICILKAILFPKQPEYQHEFRLRTTGGLELTKCLEIHILELPKYPNGDDNRRIIDPLDQWMDFFQNALGSSPSELQERLSSPIFEEAIGVLEMISRTPEQRRYYNARLKWQLDENTRREDEEAARAASMAEGIAEGIAEGEARGEIKLIRALEELLQMPISLDEAFRGKTLEELQLQASSLQEKIRNRSSSSP
jgi:predicted transposase/invertase (TIGR01784 family)